MEWLRVVELAAGVIGGGVLVALINAYATRGKVSAEADKIEADALEARIQVAAGSVIKTLQEDNSRLRTDNAAMAGKMRALEDAAVKNSNDLALNDVRQQRMQAELEKVHEVLRQMTTSEAEYKAEIARLRVENEKQEDEIGRLRARVAELEAKLVAKGG